jgi:hypothetical protein
LLGVLRGSPNFSVRVKTRGLSRKFWRERKSAVSAAFTRNETAEGGEVMLKPKLTTAAAIGLIGALGSSQARAQSSQADAEIAMLKQQLRLMEQKLDRLQ